MEKTTSISKGVFVFKNGVQPTKKKVKKKKKTVEKPVNSLFAGQLWYDSYSAQWTKINSTLQVLNKNMFSSVLSNLMDYFKDCYVEKVTEIPSAALLTGINMPDHAAQFSTLAKQIKSKITPHVACLCSQDCGNLKTLIENMIMQLMGSNDTESSSDEDDDKETEKRTKLKKYQCTFATLQTWYENQYSKDFKNRKCLTIIIPDFEGFTAHVLQEFILIASSYINILPFVLVFGVATSLNILHRSLPYHVSSKVNIHVFNSQPSTTYLNNVIEQIFFSEDCLFHLSGKVFQLFTDIFLFYDFSVTGFVQNFKYAMLEHFAQSNAFALCTNHERIELMLEQFTHNDFEDVRRLLTFRRLVESRDYEERIKLIDDDDYFKEILKEELEKIYLYLQKFHLYLKCLFILTKDLPKAPLGKQLREVYCLASNKNITKTPEYKECMQLLGFQSKKELCLKVITVCELIIEEWERNNCDELFEEAEIIKTCFENLENITNLDEDGDVLMENNQDINISEEKLDRQQLKAKLLQMSKQSKPLNKYERLRNDLLHTLNVVFEKNLKEPSSLNFYEIFFFNDVSIQTQIVGAHRAAIHTALNSPHYYLQCACCEIPNDSVILRTMPDICIAYKLHMEYGKMINLYDWLQAFLSIVDPVTAEDDEPRDVDPTLQARFTQAVAELEFLGFIKSSKRKADHVSRLTWGG